MSPAGARGDVGEGEGVDLRVCGVAVHYGVVGGVGEEVAQVAVAHVERQQNSEAEEGHGEEHLEAGGLGERGGGDVSTSAASTYAVLFVTL